MVAHGNRPGHHHQPLGKTAHQHTDGETVDRLGPKPRIQPPGDQQAQSDGDKVEDGGGKGGQAEVVQAVEQPHVNGGQGEKEDEGKEDPRQLDGQLRFARDGGKAWVEKLDQQIGLKNSDGDNGREDDEEEGVHIVGQAVGGGLALLGELLGEGGHESGREGSFGKKVAQEVRNAEGRDEGVELLAGAEDGVEEDFADQPEDPGGSDGQHDPGSAFGAHARWKRSRQAVRTSSGVRRVMHRRSRGHTLRKQGLQETL